MYVCGYLWLLIWHAVNEIFGILKFGKRVIDVFKFFVLIFVGGGRDSKGSQEKAPWECRFLFYRCGLNKNVCSHFCRLS